MLIARNVNATGMPRNSSTVEPPSISHAASPSQLTSGPLMRGAHRVVARPALGAGQPAHAEHHLDAPAAGTRAAAAPGTTIRAYQRLDVNAPPAVARPCGLSAVDTQSQRSRPGRARRPSIRSSQASRGGSARSTMSTRMCWPWRSSQGATHSVISVEQQLGDLVAPGMPRGSPGTATLRGSTSRDDDRHHRQQQHAGRPAPAPRAACRSAPDSAASSAALGRLRLRSSVFSFARDLGAWS